jgi:hypothetical protein
LPPPKNLPKYLVAATPSPSRVAMSTGRGGGGCAGRHWRASEMKPIQGSWQPERGLGMGVVSNLRALDYRTGHVHHADRGGFWGFCEMSPGAPIAVCFKRELAIGPWTASRRRKRKIDARQRLVLLWLVVCTVPGKLYCASTPSSDAQILPSCQRK